MRQKFRIASHSFILCLLAPLLLSARPRTGVFKHLHVEMSIPASAVFGLNLFSALAKLGAGTAGGLFISPLSAYIALILALNGAGGCMLYITFN